MATTREDVARLLADNWHSLPHEDGRPRRFMHFSSFGRDDETKRRILSLGLDIGHSVQFLLQRNGFNITHKDDPKAADVDGYKTGYLKCSRCGKRIMQIGFNEDMVATFNRVALRAFTQINPECPHD